YASEADVAANQAYSAIRVENTGYLGWPLLVVLIAMAIWLVLRGDRFGWWWLLTTGVTVALSLGTPVMFNGAKLGPGPWALIDEWPLTETIVAVRFTLLTTL